MIALRKLLSCTQNTTKLNCHCWSQKGYYNGESFFSTVYKTILFHRQLNATFIFAQRFSMSYLFFLLGKFKILVLCVLFVNTLKWICRICPSSALVPVPTTRVPSTAKPSTTPPPGTTLLPATHPPPDTHSPPGTNVD